LQMVQLNHQSLTMSFSSYSFSHIKNVKRKHAALICYRSCVTNFAVCVCVCLSSRIQAGRRRLLTRGLPAGYRVEVRLSTSAKSDHIRIRSNTSLPLPRFFFSSPVILPIIHWLRASCPASAWERPRATASPPPPSVHHCSLPLSH